MTKFLLAWFGVFSSPATVRHFPARAFQLLFINCCSTFLTLPFFLSAWLSVSSWLIFLRKISAFCFMFSFCHKHNISWTPGANFFSFDTNISLYSVTNYSVKSDWFSNMKKLCKLVALKDLSKAYLLITFWHS